MEFLFSDFFNGRCKYIYNMRELMCRMKEQGKQALNVLIRSDWDCIDLGAGESV